jgi:hypothetical protein
MKPEIPGKFHLKGETFFQLKKDQADSKLSLGPDQLRLNFVSTSS